MSPTTAVIIAALAFGLGGAVFIWFARQSEKRGNASLSWPTVPGKVLKSEARRGAKGSTLTDLKYGYSVAAVEYIGTLANFAGTTTAADSKRIVQQYPVGARVTVAYDPDHPSIAVLEPGSSRTRGMIVFGFVMIAAAIGALVLAVSLQL